MGPKQLRAQIERLAQLARRLGVERDRWLKRDAPVYLWAREEYRNARVVPALRPRQLPFFLAIAIPLASDYFAKCVFRYGSGHTPFLHRARIVNQKS